MNNPTLPNVDEASVNAGDLVSWLEGQAGFRVARTAQDLFEQLLERASHPKHSAANACVKLCGFAQQSAKSSNVILQQWAFGEETSMTLFNFYVEWNEQDQHRSMKLVLDVLAHLILQNPRDETRQTIKANILQTLVSISTRQSTRPLVKSSISSLNYLLNKAVCTLSDVAGTYRSVHASAGQLSAVSLWTQFIHEMFSWMQIHYICPVAGKLLVTVFRQLQALDDSHITVDLWLQWLRDGLSEDAPDTLENIKNYFFIPLFKADRDNSLRLLGSLNRLGPVAGGEPSSFGNAAMLQLAGLQVGKRCGLVDDPDPSRSSLSSSTIIINDEVLDTALAHPSAQIRSLGLSTLVSSIATSRPYSEQAFALLRRHLPEYHSDADAKFRYEVLGHTRSMTERLKGAMAMLEKAIGHASVEASTSKDDDKEANVGQDIEPASKRSKRQRQMEFADLHVLQETLDRQRAFLQWYLAFLRDELVPTASYQRHIAALKATGFMLAMRKNLSGGQGALDVDGGALIFRDYAWIRSILDRIVDAFDDVRETSVSLLTPFPDDIVSAPMQIPGRSQPTTLLKMLEEFCVRADGLAVRTARADHADGAARARGLLCKWSPSLAARITLLSGVLTTSEAKLAAADTDLGRAAIESPVHGDFASIRHVWETICKERYSKSEIASLVDSQKRIVRCCQRVWHLVKHILCDDSPEGHLPEELEDIEGLDTKDLLSYAFRATIESSNTMRSLVGTLRFSRAAGMLCPSPEVFEAVGALTFEQLSTLRHRGAFSTVTHTFATCCHFAHDPNVAASTPDVSESDSLLMSWYRGTVDCINTQVSTTRRSAGIPALMTGILGANAPRPSLEEALYLLEAIALQPTPAAEADSSMLPQVHALNCLKDIFKSSLLSRRAERYFPRFLQLAARCLASDAWAIRNGGLLLLRGVIDCLFGTSESKAELENGWDGRTTRISYTKYPELPHVVLGLLQSGQRALDVQSQQRAAESVFPALDIIRRAGPPDTLRDELYSSVVQYLGSHLWHIREMAARTVVSFLIDQDWAIGLGNLFLAARSSSNRFHGTCLAAKGLLERAPGLGLGDVKGMTRKLKAALEEISAQDPIYWCAEAYAAYLEVLELLKKAAPDFPIAQESIHLQFRERDPPSALLCIQENLRSLRAEAVTGDGDFLGRHLANLSLVDADAAAKMLELIELWEAKETPEEASRLCLIFANVCRDTSSLATWLPAALHLADAFDHLLGMSRTPEALPPTATILELWICLHQLQARPQDPSVVQATVRLSGPLVALLLLTDAPRPNPTLNHTALLSAWAAMLSDALRYEEPFDDRHAAALSLRSFAHALRATPPRPAHLPAALCLYDALLDDDDEIRAIAADAAAALLGTTRPAPAAGPADAFLGWMAAHFGTGAHFQLEAARRTAGPSFTAEYRTGAAARALDAALALDRALFAVEVQNIFVDPVRESARWAGVLLGLGGGGGGEEAARGALRAWALEGVRHLGLLVRRNGLDGPLGWTSRPAAFRVCAHVVRSAAVVVQLAIPVDEEVREALSSFRISGRENLVHDALLAMAEVESVP